MAFYIKDNYIFNKYGCLVAYRRTDDWLIKTVHDTPDYRCLCGEIDCRSELKKWLEEQNYKVSKFGF